MRLTILVVRQDRERAVQVIAKGITPFLWLPRSQIEPSDIRAGDRNITITVADWLYDQKMEEIEKLACKDRLD